MHCTAEAATGGVACRVTTAVVQLAAVIVFVSAVSSQPTDDEYCTQQFRNVPQDVAACIQHGKFVPFCNSSFPPHPLNTIPLTWVASNHLSIT
jgi:hypothetical protein